MTKLTQIGPGLNAYTFSFDSALLDKIREVCKAILATGVETDPQLRSLLFKGGKTVSAQVNVPNYSFSICSYGTAPLLWISNNDITTYGLFREFFEALDIADDVKELVDFEEKITMYSGFFVMGDHLGRELWHVDYKKGSNAYTLVTPLFDLDPAHGNLLYKDSESNIKKYTYKKNEAVIFGDHFLHTTQPYRKTSKMRVLLSLTFGTDKIRYWDALKDTIGSQSEFYFLPCGHQKGTCNCLLASH